ncbi:MAG: NADH:ubiquinone reductase (Na(+)-transporting) subunit A [Muribaculaceae bacterium]|nr:NADH:ubiquinone reductase (Na(+)-transporting) subunit A [Muribaculaceae bacterium]
MDIKIKKGLDLKLAGGIENVSAALADCRDVHGVCAICPEDYPGFKPKALVKEGDMVYAGEPVLYNKDYEGMTLVSPIDGRVKAVVRGDRRRILRVEIEPIEAGEAVPRTIFPIEKGTAANVVSSLAHLGLLARLRQRPYDVVPTEGTTMVRDIYVMCFDAAPLALSLPLEAFGNEAEEWLRSGLAVLSRLTTGKVYVACREGDKVASVSGGVPGVEIVKVAGPYPSGLPGAVIAATKPINKGETVWTLDLATAIRVGEYAKHHKYGFENYVALTGSELSAPGIAKAPDGIELKALLKGVVKDTPEHKRIISGNVFTGVRESEDGYLRFPYRQVTVIPEGDDTDEFMGWASLAPSKVSAKRSFPLSFMRKLFSPDARLNGGRRAMIMSGEYDRYMPIDILPEYLVKAILAKDVEGMERLGIYEVAPEDFALAEFADTSKLPLQQIVRDGLDYLRKELE